MYLDIGSKLQHHTSANNLLSRLDLKFHNCEIPLCSLHITELLAADDICISFFRCNYRIHCTEISCKDFVFCLRSDSYLMIKLFIYSAMYGLN